MLIARLLSPMNLRLFIACLLLVMFTGCQGTATSPSQSAIQRAADGKEKAAKFFGLKVDGKRVVFILDQSGSMLDTFDFLRQEMVQTVEKLDPGQSFSVIMVAWEASAIYPKLEAATDTVKKDFAERMTKIRPQGMSDILLEPYREGFEKAFVLKPDAIYFVTDGVFDPALADVVKKLNSKQNVRVHTVAYVTHGSMYEKQLEEIAKTNGGTYKFVEERDLGK